VTAIPMYVSLRAIQNTSETEDGCQISVYAVNGYGFPQIGWTVNGKRHGALVARAVWEFAYGSLPPGQSQTVSNTCGNSRCVNPEHLRLRPKTENTKAERRERPDPDPGTRGCGATESCGRSNGRRAGKPHLATVRRGVARRPRRPPRTPFEGYGVNLSYLCTCPCGCDEIFVEDDRCLADVPCDRCPMCCTCELI
jgi:hypothetical protein